MGRKVFFISSQMVCGSGVSQDLSEVNKVQNGRGLLHVPLK